MKKFLLIISIVIASVIAIVILSIGAIQVAVKPNNGNLLLDKYLTNFIKAKAHYDSIDVNIYKTWPYVEVRFDNVLIKTLAFEQPDTLLLVKTLGAKVNLVSLLTSGEINVPYLTIDEPYIKVQKKDSIYSWDVVEPSDEDTTSSEIPQIYADALEINNARFVYRDMDSHFIAMVDSFSLSSSDTEILSNVMKSFTKIGVAKISYQDSLSNRVCSIENFKIEFNAFRNDTITNLLLFNANSSKISLTDSMFSIKRTALDVYARAWANSEYSKFDIDTLGVKIDETTLALNGVVSPEYADTLSIGVEKLNIKFNCPSIWRLKSFVPSQFSEELNKYVFDGAIGFSGSANGRYRGSELPAVKANLRIKNLNGGVKAYKQRIQQIDLDAYCSFEQKRKDSTYIVIKNLFAETQNNTIDASGWAGYVNGREYVDADVNASLDLKVLNELYKFDEKQKMKGTLRAKVNGKFFLDDLKKMDLYKIYSTAEIKGDKIGVLIPSQRLGIYTDSLRILLNTNTTSLQTIINRATQIYGKDSINGISKLAQRGARLTETAHTLSNNSKTVRYDTNDTVLVNFRVGFSSLKLWYKRRVKAESNRFLVTLLADDIEPGKVPRFRTAASFRGLNVTVDDSIKFKAKRMIASVNVAKNADRLNVPTTSLRFAFDSITACSSNFCALLDSTRIKLAATPRLRIGKRKGKTAAQIDSMKAVASQKIVDMPALISLFDSISKAPEPAELFMKRFNSYGTIYSRRLKIKDEDFPLKMGVSRLDLELNDDTIHLNNIRPRIGKSSVKISGEVINLRRYLLRGKPLYANFTLKSKRVDLNQITRAFYTYNKNKEERKRVNRDTLAAEVERNARAIEKMSDEEELTQEADSTQGLVVLPKNWDFKFKTNIDTLKISNLRLNDFEGVVRVKDSRLKIWNLSTSTEVGHANMNVMYECSSPEKASGTIAVNMDSVQVGDLITYLPELDSVMPMLRSFSGSVKCDASAYCNFDSLFNIQMPSVNAALKLKGNDLVLLDGETFTQIAKLLMFNKKTKNVIDSVAVELLVENNEVMIYPFMVGMDKYRLGVGGVQNLDMSFKYHIVVLKPVLLSGIGLDVYGTDFDNIKFKLSTPKFQGFDVAIKTGGQLVRTSNVNPIERVYEKMINAILKED